MTHDMIAMWLAKAPKGVAIHAKLRASTGWSMPVVVSGRGLEPTGEFTLMATRYRGSRSFVLNHRLEWLNWGDARIAVDTIKVKAKSPLWVPFNSLPEGTRCWAFQMKHKKYTYLGAGVWADDSGVKKRFTDNGMASSHRSRRAIGDLDYSTISFIGISPQAEPEKSFDFNEWSVWFFKHKEGK